MNSDKDCVNFDKFFSMLEAFTLRNNTSIATVFFKDADFIKLNQLLERYEAGEPTRERIIKRYGIPDGAVS